MFYRIKKNVYRNGYGAEGARIIFTWIRPPFRAVFIQGIAVASSCNYNNIRINIIWKTAHAVKSDKNYELILQLSHKSIIIIIRVRIFHRKRSCTSIVSLCIWLKSRKDYLWEFYDKYIHFCGNFVNKFQAIRIVRERERKKISSVPYLNRDQWTIYNIILNNILLTYMWLTGRNSYWINTTHRSRTFWVGYMSRIVHGYFRFPDHHADRCLHTHTQIIVCKL